ncbi:MAG: hypothetical protein K0S86_1203 [Geminicoccaceae bacterium]|jgi:hypothetical protein|nr:hypothetical protein [Geminicoccaceae bacterium]
MRIAVSGSHATGKSTLVAELVRRLPDVTSFDEPYYLLEAEGHAFAAKPTTGDFELLLERAVSLLAAPEPRTAVFDRCPADYLAYLAALSPAAISPDRTAEAAVALQTLDLVIFVPLERPDRIAMAEAPVLRRHVDRILREMLVENAWGFDMPVVTVHGTPEERADHVVAFLESATRTGVAGGARPGQHRR